MTKKTLLAIFVLAVVIAGYYLSHNSAPHVEWTTYDGKLARLDLPTSWKAVEYGDRKAQSLDLNSKTKDEGFFFFSLAEYLPNSGKNDIDGFVKDTIEASAHPHPIVVKQTSFGRFPAQEFSTYTAETIDPPSGEGVRALQASYVEIRHLVFKRENGLICEVAYALPEKNPAGYDPIFRRVVDSIQLK